MTTKIIVATREPWHVDDMPLNSKKKLPLALELGEQLKVWLWEEMEQLSTVVFAPRIRVSFVRMMTRDIDAPDLDITLLIDVAWGEHAGMLNDYLKELISTWLTETMGYRARPSYELTIMPCSTHGSAVDSNGVTTRSW